MLPDRRSFLGFCASTGLTSTLLPGTLWAQIQPGTRAITLEMVREAARLAGLDWSDEECLELRDSLSSLAKHAEGIDKASLTNASPLPWEFNPRAPGMPAPPMPRGGFRLEAAPRVRRPANLEAVAFWPVTHLAELVRTRQVTATELTRMYLARLRAHNGVLNCVAALTEERALAEAAAADREIAAGKYRGVLHGIPYGVKDIIAATGAPPLQDQVIDHDAAVVERLAAAGAVLVAKLTTGEMAFGDQWAGGRTNNPWNPQEGSSGSSAGPGAATAAGLVAFSIGTDTGGSILSPSIRCGLVGLRPTFGRVSRYGVMNAGTTLDKIGPMCRHAQDCAVVLQAIAGPDDRDLAVLPGIPVTFDPAPGRHPRRIGYVPAMMEAEQDPERRANNERALARVKAIGGTLVPVSLPGGDLSYFIEYTERAAGFDSFVAAGLHKGLRPRTSRYLRACQLVTAVDYLQANRRRAAIMQAVARVFEDVEAILFTTESLDSRTSLNPVMSLTGHPSIAVPNGVKASGSPAGVMFSARLYHEGDLVALARAWQAQDDQVTRQPPLFAAR